MKANTKGSTRRKKLLVLLAVLLFVTACATTKQPPITPESTGFWDGVILKNFSAMIIYLSQLFNHNYAVGIILFTIIIRVLLIPLYQYQMQGSEVMQLMQPEMDAARRKYASRDVATQEKLSNEIQKIQKKYNYSTWKSFLPLFLQLPILIALYQAIIRTEVLTNGHFLWMSLGQPDPFLVLPIIAALATFYTSYLSRIAVPSSGKSMQIMQWIMPIFIFLIMLPLPSAIALYMATTNIFTIIQTLLISNPYQKRDARLEQEKKKKDLERRLKKAKRHPKR